MQPAELAKKYNKIAEWWHQNHSDSDYGVVQFKLALNFCTQHSQALDVGCGAGGRFIRMLKEKGFNITGLDISEKMVDLAQKNHPEDYFFVQDICSWETAQKFDFIYAWDSIFHLPFNKHHSVISKLCSLLNSGGILMYTLGNATGENTDEWLDDTFYYSSIGINANAQLLLDNGLNLLHLELDQYPERHVFVVAAKP